MDQNTPEDGKRPKRVKARCCVPNCISHQKNSEEVVHHIFPTREELKKKWLDSLKIPDELSKKALVCSYHFQESDYFRRAEGDPRSRQTLKRNAIPSPLCRENPAKKISRKSKPIIQGKRVFDNPLCPVLPKLGKQTGNAEVSLAADQKHEPTPELSKSGGQRVDEASDANSMNKLHDGEESSNRYGHHIIKTEGVLSETDSASEEDKDCLNSDAPHNSIQDTSKSISNTHPSANAKVKSEQGSSQYFVVNKHVQKMQAQKERVASFIRSEADLYQYTGISFELLTDLQQSVDFYERKVLYKKLTDSRTRIILCLTRLKLHLAYLRLGPMIGLTTSSCIEIFRYMIILLSKILTKLIFWPPREENFQKLPTSSESSKRISIAFELIEIPVEDPVCSNCRSRLRSTSNSGIYTVKVLIGIASTGLIVYISETFGGQAFCSDILQQTNVLSRLDPSQDVVMINKNNNDIETECLIQSISVIKPSRTNVFNMKQDEEGPHAFDIINARARVECTLESLKTYGILKGKIKVALIPYVEEIITVIGALINLQISTKVLQEMRDQQC